MRKKLYRSDVFRSIHSIAEDLHAIGAIDKGTMRELDRACLAVLDGHVTPTGKSVLDELRLDPAFVVKAKLAIRIQKSIGEMGLKQREAGARMGITQPKLSLIARGKLDDISQAKLEACLRTLGHAIEIAIGPRRNGVGGVTVRDAA